MRTLDYCGVRSLCGREIADELFGRAIPAGIDMDFPPDADMVEGIVADRERQFARCETCPDRDRCDPPG